MARWPGGQVARWPGGQVARMGPYGWGRLVNSVQVANCWGNGPVSGLQGCYSFAFLGMTAGLAQVAL